MFNKKILLEILKELKRQNVILEKLDMCIRKDESMNSYLNTKPYPII